ncbi:MAG: hypothetical protein D6776_00885, partial [Planctomycetota bacterium]
RGDMGLRWIRKRDGRRVTFDVRKLAQSLRAAAAEAGESILAEEIAEVVSLFLEKQSAERIARGDAVPSTEDVQDIVERVLLDTNHARTAAVLAERHHRKGKQREEIRVQRSGLAPLAPDGEPLAEPAPEPWNEGKIAHSLQRHCGLQEAVAEEVARDVEQRILRLGLREISATLVREVVNAVLAERGFHARLAEPEVLAIRAEQIRSRLAGAIVRPVGGAAAIGGPEATVGAYVLGRWALEHIYPPEVAHAHRTGAIHIQDLGRPLRVATGAISLDERKRQLGSGAPRSAAEALAAVATLLGELAPHHARQVALPYVNVFLSPFACRREATVRRDLREGLRMLAAACIPQPLLLHLGPVPQPLRDRAPVGVGARRWRTGYGELETESDRVANWIAQLVPEVRSGLGTDRLQLAAAIPPGATRPPWAEHADVLLLDSPELAPPMAQGLCEATALREPSETSPLCAGALKVIGLNCARAAYEAGPGNEPGLRSRLHERLALCIEAFASHARLLESTIFKPPLPLWDGGPRAPRPPVADPARSVCVLALVGLDVAMTALTGERMDDNAAAFELAVDLARELAEAARRLGVERGLTVRLEEPHMPAGTARLTDLDLQRHPEASRRVLGDASAMPGRYTTRLAPPPRSAPEAAALLEQLYLPLRLSPWCAAADCPDAFPLLHAAASSRSGCGLPGSLPDTEA